MSIRRTRFLPVRAIIASMKKQLLATLGFSLLLSACGGGSSTTGNIVASAATSTQSSTTVQNVSSTGEVKETRAEIKIDPRPVAILTIEMPGACEPCREGTECRPCAISTGTQISLRQGETRSVFGYVVHALRIDEKTAVLIKLSMD